MYFILFLEYISRYLGNYQFILIQIRYSIQKSTKTTMSEYSPTSLHVPSSEFLSHLSKHPEVPTRELLQPYLAYELWLRKAFAKGEIKLDHLVNLVPIYDGSESLFKIRTIDRETSARDKYIMPLKQHEQEVNDAPAIATSFQDYRNNFEAFTRGQ